MSVAGFPGATSAPTGQLTKEEEDARVKAHLDELIASRDFEEAFNTVSPFFFSSFFFVFFFPFLIILF